MPTTTYRYLLADFLTNEIVAELPLTNEELAQREADAQAAETARLEQDAEAQRIETLKVSARAKLTSGQPMTEKEAALFVI